jgi:hypothetical protein
VNIDGVRGRLSLRLKRATHVGTSSLCRAEARSGIPGTSAIERMRPYFAARFARNASGSRLTIRLVPSSTGAGRRPCFHLRVISSSIACDRHLLMQIPKRPARGPKAIVTVKLP